ncbi:VanZ family protein [bacterium]|nr:hypothetical protein [bacterium]MBU3955377.1 VanZ family protein [bacterium]MBU4133857.1 VanZ family protein [bacterium]
MVFIKWLAVVMWAKLIYYLSDIPGLDMGLGIWDLFVRKSAHIFEFAYLTALLYLALLDSARIKRRTLAIFAAVPALLYAFSDEFHQLYVPKRHGSIADVAVDAVGILIVCYLILRTDLFSNESGILRGGIAK